MNAEQKMQAALRTADFEAAFEHAQAWQRESAAREDLGALYYLSWICLELQRFESAARWLSRLLDASVQQEETWYVETALLMRAYVWTELGLFDRAESDLLEVEPVVEPDEGVFWLLHAPVITPSLIRRRVAERRSPDA